MRSAIYTWIIVLLVSGTSLQGQAKNLSLDQAIAKLQNGNVADQKLADDSLDAIANRGLTIADGLRIADAAGEKASATKTKDMFRSPAARLLGMLCADAKPEYLKPVADAYDNLPTDAKPVALAIFVALGPGDGLRTFVGKLNDQVQTDFNCDKAFEKLAPGDPAVIDALMQMLQYEGSSGTSVQTLLKFVEQGMLPAKTLAKNIPLIGQSYQHWLDKMSEIAKRLHSDTNPDYRWDDDFRQVQGVAEYFPDLLGHAGSGAEPLLRKTLEVKDLRLSLFALRSLLALDKDVPADAVKLVAGDDEVREQLYEAFAKKGIQSQFPREFATQEALARSEMVRWLIYPTELERGPNDIELMKVVSEDSGGADGIVDIYLFRFRTTGKHWAAKDGWMVGTAGGYRRSEEPTINALGDTFSTFEKWDAKTPEQHVKDIQDLLHEAWKKQASDANSSKAKP